MELFNDPPSTGYPVAVSEVLVSRECIIIPPDLGYAGDALQMIVPHL